jgi:hypothetical protein
MSHTSIKDDIRRFTFPGRYHCVFASEKLTGRLLMAAWHDAAAVVSPENDPVAHPSDLTCFEAPKAAERIQCEMMGSSATPRLDAAL